MADSTKVIATRDVLLYYVETASGNALPPLTVDWGTAWGTPSGQTNPWINPGYTQGGLHLSTEVARADIRADQELDPVLRPATSRTANMNASLLQFSPATIVVATGQGAVTSVAPGAGTKGSDTFALSSTVDDKFYSIGFDIKAQDDEPIRFVGWRGQTVGSPTWDIVPEQALLTPLNVTLFPDTTTTPARILTIQDVIPAV